MTNISRRNLILLHLLDRSDRAAGSEIPELCGALEVPPESMADRIALLSALSELEERGLVVNRTRPVDSERGGQTRDGESDGGERRVYALTPEGRKRARTLREQFESRSVLIEDDDGTRDVPLGEIDRYLETDSTATDSTGAQSTETASTDAKSLVSALARVSSDGILRVGRSETDRFVDRRTAIDAMEAALDAVAAGESRTVLVTGEAGIGKTSLVARTLESARDRGFAVLEGAGSSDANEPYRAFREALEPTATDPFDRTIDPIDDEDAFGAGRRALFDDVADVLAGGAEEPTACFVDDLHWADAGTLALFSSVAETVDGPLLLVGTYREEGLSPDHDLHATDDWLDGVDPLTVSLEPFDRSATRALIAQLLDVDSPTVPSPFVSAVHERTGGNPLFVNELVSAMLDEGRVDPARGIYPASDDAAVPMPERVESAIDVRFDVLDRTAETILETAAVIGPTIPLSLLATVVDAPEATLREYVDVLAGARIWDPVDGDRVRFVSDVVRETALDRLDDDRRRQRHETVADAFAESDGARAATVAYHYEAASDHERALEYYREAGDDAMDVYAHEVAIEHYESALELARELDAVDVVHDLLISIGRCYNVRSDYDEADRYFEYVQEHATDPETLTNAVQFRAQLDNKRSDYDRALERVRTGLEYWDGETPSRTVCTLLSAKAWARKQSGDLDGALETASRERELAEQLDDRAYEAIAFLDAANVEQFRGHLERALEKYHRAGEIFETVGDRWRLSVTLNNEGLVHWQRGDLDAAAEAFDRAREIDESIGDATSIARVDLNLGILAVKRGEWAAASEQFESAREQMTELGNDLGIALSIGNHGHLSYRRGNLETARDRISESIDRFEAMGDDHHRTIFSLHLAEYLVLVDELDGAKAVLEDALSTAIDIESKTQVASARAILATVAREAGDAETAIERAESALELAETLEDEDTIQVRRELARAYLADGRVDAALDVAATAMDARDSLSDPWGILQIEGAYGVCLGEAGDLAAAEERLESAIESARSLGARIEECRFMLEYGRLARRQDDTQTARSRIETALAIAEETGATLFERECRAALDSMA
jgi:tetratricopeptide (TPR) repeat protein/DNA-binding PadR family transcriptional regulator